VEEHPDGHPRRQETVYRRDYDDADCDKKFEGKWIDDATSTVINTKKDAKRCQRSASNELRRSEY